MNGIEKQPDAWQPLEEAVPADLFRVEVRAWAARIGVEPGEIHIRPMKRKWASCSSRGRLTFDIGLLRQPAYQRAEVIVHELLHLKLPNHGPLFRALMQAYLSGKETPIYPNHGAASHFPMQDTP